MSEIFEALLKAQREADSRRATPSATAAEPAGDPGNRTEQPGDRVRTRTRPAKTSGGSSGWFRWVRRGASNNGRAQNGGLLVSPHSGTAIGERFRVLRARIELAGPGAVMVTSALDQEGKTLCATNLAVALSTSIGGGVILVDADLRHGTVGAYFGTNGGQGLVDCLTGDARWQDCLVPTSFESLRVLPAGRRSVLAPELLGSERMRAVIAEIRAQYPQHYVVLDTPPILLTADPMVVARNMDHILLVVRAGITPRAAVLKAVEAIGVDRFLGIIFNDAADDLSSYMYYKGRYSYSGHEGHAS